MKYFEILLVSSALVALAIAESESMYNSTTVTTTETTVVPKKTNESLRQTRCYSTQFQCANGECINRDLLCDGNQDCKDGSDENFSICFTPGGVTTTLATVATERSHGINDIIGDRGDFSCASDEFLCTSGECIKQIYVCDGKRNCVDSSDELSAICPGVSSGKNGKRCLTTEFQCSNGECIFGGFRCDGTTHCSDNSDEDWSICQSANEEKPAATQRPVVRPNQGGNTGDSSSAVGSTGVNDWRQKLIPCNVPIQPANGRWRIHRSLCDSNIECAAPSNIRTMQPGSYLVYSCDQGFVLNGTSNVLCGPGGRWVHTPTCDEIKCTVLSSSTTEALCMWNNVAVSCEVPVPIGTTAKLKCRKGFVQEVMYEQAYRDVKCPSDGNWTPKPIQCVKIPKKVKLVLEGDMILQD